MKPGGGAVTHPFHGGEGGDLRSDCMLDWGRWRPSVRSRARSGDYPSISRWAQAARSGWWRPSVKSRARLGQMETFGQVACSVRRLPIHFMAGTGGTIKSFTARKDGDLRSGRVLGRETTHPFHGGTGGTIRMRANIFPTGGKLALIAGNKTEKKKGLTAFKMANPLSLFTSPDQGVSTSFAHSRLSRYQSTRRFSPSSSDTLGSQPNSRRALVTSATFSKTSAGWVGM